MGVRSPVRAGEVAMDACEKIRDLLSEYLDGELDERAAGEIRSHLASCESCRGELERLHRVSAAVKALPKVPAPKGFARRVAVRLAAEASPRVSAARRRPSAARVWIPAAAAALLALSVTLSLMTHYWREDVGRSLPDYGSAGVARKSEKGSAAERGALLDADSSAKTGSAAPEKLFEKPAGAERKVTQPGAGVGLDAADRSLKGDKAEAEHVRSELPDKSRARGGPGSVGGGGAGSGRYVPAPAPERSRAGMGAERESSADRARTAVPDAVRPAAVPPPPPAAAPEDAAAATVLPQAPVAPGRGAAGAPAFAKSAAEAETGQAGTGREKGADDAGAFRGGRGIGAQEAPGAGARAPAARRALAAEPAPKAPMGAPAASFDKAEELKRSLDKKADVGSDEPMAKALRLEEGSGQGQAAAEEGGADAAPGKPVAALAEQNSGREKYDAVVEAGSEDEARKRIETIARRLGGRLVWEGGPVAVSPAENAARKAAVSGAGVERSEAAGLEKSAGTGDRLAGKAVRRLVAEIVLDSADGKAANSPQAAEKAARREPDGRLRYKDSQPSSPQAPTGIRRAAEAEPAAGGNAAEAEKFLKAGKAEGDAAADLDSLLLHKLMEAAASFDPQAPVRRLRILAIIK